MIKTKRNLNMTTKHEQVFKYENVTFIVIKYKKHVARKTFNYEALLITRHN